MISFLNWATEREYYSGTKHLKFKAPERNIDIIYLTEDELDKRYFHKFENKKLDRVRDVFCLGCYTGQNIRIFEQSKFKNMGAIVIKSDSKSLKLIAQLAKRLGSQVTKLDDEQLEDFTFGQMLKEAKTGETVSRESIMQKLQ